MNEDLAINVSITPFGGNGVIHRKTNDEESIVAAGRRDRRERIVRGQIIQILSIEEIVYETLTLHRIIRIVGGKNYHKLY